MLARGFSFLYPGRFNPLAYPIFYGFPVLNLLTVGLTLGLPVLLSFRNRGWLLAVGAMYLVLLGMPTSDYHVFPPSWTGRLVAELTWPLFFSVTWGTGCYFVGFGLHELATRVRRPTRQRG